MNIILENLTPGISHWLILTAILFSIGIYGMLTRKNAVGILMAVELALNSGALNFVVFGRAFTPNILEGDLMAIFIIAVAAAEVIVALAILVALYKQMKTVDVTRINALKN